MNWPLQFPDPLEESRKRSEEFQKLSSDERIHQMRDTIEAGMFMIRESKNRAAIDELFHAREKKSQAIQVELMSSHG